MTTSFDDHADDAMALGVPVRLQAIVDKLDDVLLVCAISGLSDATVGGRVDVEPAWDYLDEVAITPGLLQQLLVYLRWPLAEHAAHEHASQFDAEAAALLGPVAGRAPVLPMTCPAPDAHARQARRDKPVWWLRVAGLLDGTRPDDAPCPVCELPLPKSHRRHG